MKLLRYLFLAAWGLSFMPHVHADVPGILSYQGRLSQNNGNYAGPVRLKFALVDGVTGTTYWANDDGSSVNGSEPTEYTIVNASGNGGFFGFTPLECSLTALSCAYMSTTAPYEQLQLIVPVNLGPGAKSGETVELTVNGENAPPVKVKRAMTAASTASMAASWLTPVPADDHADAQSEGPGDPDTLPVSARPGWRHAEGPEFQAASGPDR